MRQQTRSLAFGGIMAALCWAILISTGMLPFMSYTTPAIAGFMLVAVAFENGVKWAYLTYAAVSLLCCVLATDIEAVVLFVILFGYYPVLRIRLEVMRPVWLVAIIKTALFSVSIILSYIIITFVLGLAYLADEIAVLPPTLTVVAASAVLAVFWVYDIAIGNMTRLYILVIRPRLKSIARM